MAVAVVEGEAKDRHGVPVVVAGKASGLLPRTTAPARLALPDPRCNGALVGKGEPR
jgi:hypothetical protein